MILVVPAREQLDAPQQFTGFRCALTQHAYFAVQVGHLVGQPHGIRDRSHHAKERDAAEDENPDHETKWYPAGTARANGDQSGGSPTA